MIWKFITRLFRGRHYWRQVSFDEIADLYASRLMTVFAINIVNLFAAIYLYQLGYSFVVIGLCYALWYGLRLPFAPLAMKYVAYFGPKHGVLAANIMRIPSLVAFALVPEYGFWAIMVFGILQQLSATLYDLSYLVDFSRVKSVRFAGKEIGTMQILEKIAKITSPVVGGIIATVYGPQVTIIVAAVVFVLAALPLFRTIEPSLMRAPLKFAGFPWRLTRRSIVANFAPGFDFIASGMVWMLFVTITVFSTAGEGVYAALGALASIGVLVSIVAAWVFGQIVDRRKGGVLLAVGTITKTVTHLFRPFITTPVGVLGTNMVTETATTAYVMPFTRLMLDTADTSGFRHAYILYAEMMLYIGAGLACLIFAGLVWLLGDVTGSFALFFVASIVQLMLLLVRRHAN